MNSQWKQLTTILEQQLQPYNCLADVQERASSLLIVLRHAPGAVPDAQAVQSIVLTGLDAVFAPDIPTVKLYAVPLREENAEPQPLGSFAYEGVGPQVELQGDKRTQEYLLFRLLLLSVGVLGLVMYLFSPAISHLVAALVAIVLALTFGVCRRALERTPPFVRRSIVLIGGFLIGAGLVFLTRSFPEAFSVTAIACAIGAFAVRLGWK